MSVSNLIRLLFGHHFWQMFEQYYINRSCGNGIFECISIRRNPPETLPQCFWLLNGYFGKKKIKTIETYECLFPISTDCIVVAVASPNGNMPNNCWRTTAVWIGVVRWNWRRRQPFADGWKQSRTERHCWSEHAWHTACDWIVNN